MEPGSAQDFSAGAGSKEEERGGRPVKKLWLLALLVLLVDHQGVTTLNCPFEADILGLPPLLLFSGNSPKGLISDMLH